MQSTIAEYSMKQQNYLVLKLIQEMDRDSVFIENDFNRLVVESADAWLSHLDERVNSENQIITLLKNDLRSELKEGNYLNYGKDKFIKQVIKFLGEDEYKNRAYY